MPANQHCKVQPPEEHAAAAAMQASRSNWPLVARHHQAEASLVAPGRQERVDESTSVH